MISSDSHDSDFINKLKKIVEKNLPNPKFGVSALAREMGMSRTNLHRRVNSLFKISVSQYICHERLKKAKEILRKTSSTVAEVSYEVGFSSPTYFSKCFHDYFGYSPGKIGERIEKESHGIFSKKNLVYNIIIGGLLVIVIAFALPKIFRDKSGSDLEKSIAVLPFKDIGSDEDKAWFSDGITDIIINQLSKISELRVLGWTTTQKYKEEKKSIAEIGKELGVNYVIEGIVQLHEEDMLISVQLIRVINEDNVWSYIYDRKWKDILVIESEIAEQIAHELKAVLSPEDKEQIEKKQTVNSKAYNLYQHGRYFIKQRTIEGIKKSIGYCEKAIAEDANYALGYAGLADAYFLLAFRGQIQKEEGYNKSKKYAYKAIEIDKNLAEAHAVLGGVLTWYDWKWEEARKELQLATELNSKYVNAQSYYSELLNILRDNSGAREHINIALEIDPFFWIIHKLSALYYFNQGKYKESVNACLKLKEFNPVDSEDSYLWYLFDSYLRLGEELKAVETLQEIMRFHSDTVIAGNAAHVKDIYNKSGLNGVLNRQLELWLTRMPDDYWALAKAYARVNQKEEALYYLEKMFENRHTALPELNNRRELETLRSEPRFQALLKKLGLSGYQIPK